MSEELLSPQTAEQFRYIELMLLYEGALTNKQLRDRFNVTQVQASRVIKKYRDDKPGYMEPVSGRGNYCRGHKLSYKESTHSIGSYLDEKGTSIDSANIAKVQDDLTQANPAVVRELVQAATRGYGVQILYCSMNHPLGKARLVFPHAFAFAGSRWHVRAFDMTSNDFRDFNFGRIESAAPEAHEHRPDIIDAEWEEFVELTIEPHPQLTPDQQRMIRREYFGGTSGRIIKIRQALEMYTLRHLEIATDTQKQLPPEFLLAMVRRKEI